MRSVLYANRPLVLVLLAQVLTMVYLDPRFEFPLNDDWAWIRAAELLVVQGRLVVPDFSVASLVGHTLYGGAWCACLGFSMTVLRLSVLSLWLVLAAGAYWLLRELDETPWPAAAGAAVVVFNPMTVCLAFSFMTDVPFLAWATLAVACYVRGARTGRPAVLWAAGLLASWAVLVRQIGLFVPLTVALCVLAQRADRRGPLRRWLGPILLPVLVFAVYQTWFLCVRGPTIMYRIATLTGFPDLLLQIPERLLVFAAYAGLFAAPLAPALLLAWRDRLRRDASERNRLALWGAVLGVGFAVAYLGFGARMPLVGNYFSSTGIGPYSLRDSGVGGYAHPLVHARAVWGVLALVVWLSSAVVAACLHSLVAAAWRRGRDRWREWLWAPGMLVVVTHLSLVSVYLALSYVYDRYLISLALPAVAIVLAARRGVTPAPARGAGARRATLALLLACLGAWTLWGVLGTDAYLNWNRARWRALSALMAENVPAERIDGGTEFNGYFLYEQMKHNVRTVNGRSNWWVADDAYAISMMPLAGYEVVSRWPFRIPLARQPRHILVLKRSSAR